MKKLIFTLLLLSTTLFVYGQHDEGLTDPNNLSLGMGAGGSLYNRTAYGSYLGTNGYKNLFVGPDAGSNSTTADRNVFLGHSAGSNNVTGDSNVFLGYEAGYMATGSNNVFIGYKAGKTETGSNKLYINNGNTTGPGPLIYGDFANKNVGINTKNSLVTLALRANGATHDVGITQGLVGGTATMEFTTDDNAGTQATRLLIRGNTQNAPIEFYRGKRGEEVMSMIIGGEGNVGIGTTAPDQKLSVNGNASKTGGGSWTTFSDIRTKKNINSFEDGLNIVLQMHPVRFQYNGTAGYADTGKEYVGVIAQKVQKYAPYMIETVAKKLRETDEKETDLLMYDSSALAYILVNAIKEQQKIIENQQQKMEALENRVADTAAKESLQQRIKALENLVATMVKKVSNTGTLHAAASYKK